MREILELSTGVRKASHILVLAEHTNLAADRLCRHLVVASNDNDADTCLPAGLDCVSNLHTRGVQHADQADEGHVLLVVHEASRVREIVLGKGLGARDASNGKHTQSPLAHAELSLLDGVHARAVERDHGASRGNKHVLAAAQHGLRGTLHEEEVLSRVLVAYQSAHRLAVARELEGGQLLVLALQLAVAVLRTVRLADTTLHSGICHLLHQHTKRDLRGLSNALVLAGVLLEVDASVAAQAANLRQLQQGLVRCSIDLLSSLGIRKHAGRLVRSARHRKLLQRSPSAALVAHDSHVANRHLVGRESASLVGANDRSAAKSLDRGQRADDSVVLRHLHGAKGKARGDHGRQALGDSRNSKSDCDLEVVHSTSEEATMLRVVEVIDVDEPDENADDEDHLREELAKVVQLLLKWRSHLIHVLNVLPDLAELGGSSSARDQTASTADGDVGSSEEHVDLVLVHGTIVRDDVDDLGDADTLASEHGLVHTEGDRPQLDDAKVRRDVVAHCNLHDISWNELGSIDRINLAVADHSCSLGYVRLKGLDGLLGVGLLQNTNDGVCNKYEPDHEGLDESRELVFVVLEEREHKGDHGSTKQDLDKLVIELGKHELPQRSTLLRCSLVAAILGAVLFDLRLCEALARLYRVLR
mmetsp:Transcript_2324/g.8265  ORF Transcript_2324/g.8265 Transcript_2324/m.8265 type:complete len:645 (-) Transcript_2324:205-2139(-)